MKKNKPVTNLLLAFAALLFFISAANPSIGFIVESVDIEQFPIIKLKIGAWESSGAALKSLKASDFQIREAQSEPISPDKLEIDTNSPLAVALVLDVSGSMVGQALDDAQVAAARFLDRLGDQDQVALVAFSDDVNPDPNQLKAHREYAFTDDLKAIYDAVEGLQASGGTQLYNALQKAIALTAQLPEGHRAILLLSDGVNDPPDAGDPEIPIQMAKDLNIPIFTIGLGNYADHTYLTRLAEETGGLVRFAPRSSELAQTFKDIADMLKTQYILTWQSQLKQAGEQVSFEVSLSAGGATQQKTLLVTGLDAKISHLNQQEALLANSEPQSEPETAENSQSPSAAQQELSQPEPPAQPILINEDADPSDPALNQLLRTPWTWLGLLALIFVFAFFVSRRRKKTVPRVCARCGYKLDASATTCPECGETKSL